MKTRVVNPFRYGKPVFPKSFVGREDVLRTIFGRINNGESTAVVGPPHIGKSSVLRYVADEQMRSQWLQAEPGQLAFVEFDCHILPEAYQPADFWRHILQQAQELFSESVLQSKINGLLSLSFNIAKLEELFRYVGIKDAKLVLLIDEFDALLNHPHFNRAEFFGALRSLSSRTDGLVLVTASRLSMSQMNRRSSEINPLGSPFFNTVTEVRLLPLRETEVNCLFDRALTGSSLSFSKEERSLLQRLSGRHPYLLQAAAAVLFDEAASGLSEQERCSRLSEILGQRVSAFCEDLWRHMDTAQQKAVLLLASYPLRSADAYEIGVEDLARYGPAIRQLAELGVAERLDAHADHRAALTWQGASWGLAAKVFSAWLAENDIGSAGIAAAAAPVSMTTGLKRLFYSYCFADEALLQQLETHLALLRHQGILVDWHQGRADHGHDHQEEINQHIQEADIILLLLSSDFIASDYLYDVEMAHALERHRAKTATVIPILLRPVNLQGAPFHGIQVLPANGLPVTSWLNQDAAWQSIAERIRQVATTGRA